MKIFIFLSVSFLSSSICFRNLEKIKVRDETVTEIISAGKNANAFYENCLVRLNPNRLGFQAIISITSVWVGWGK